MSSPDPMFDQHPSDNTPATISSSVMITENATDQENLKIRRHYSNSDEFKKAD